MESRTAFLNDYIEYINRIHDYPEGKDENLAEDLINFCTERSWQTPAVLLIISVTAENSLRHLREYWELFKRIYNHFQIMPSTVNLYPHIAALFSKEYQKVFEIPGLPFHLENYRNMEIEQILQIYEPSSKMHCILHDNAEEFAVFMGPIINEETFNEIVDGNSLLEWCSYYGSLRCFRYLHGQYAIMTIKCLAYSFIGKNKEIINECLVEAGEILKESSIIPVLFRINEEDYLDALHSDYNQEWTPDMAAVMLNLKAFLKFATFEDDEEMVTYSYFGITENCILQPLATVLNLL